MRQYATRDFPSSRIVPICPIARCANLCWLSSESKVLQEISLIEIREMQLSRGLCTLLLELRDGFQPSSVPPDGRAGPGHFV